MNPDYSDYLGPLAVAAVLGWVIYKIANAVERDKLGGSSFNRRQTVKFWVGYGLLASLFIWMIGTSVESFPGFMRGRWVDDRGVAVMITDREVQWHTAAGVPSKRWRCERFHAGPFQVLFHVPSPTGQKEKDLCIEIRPGSVFDGWHSMQFGGSGLL